jgi:hypothetical protein
VGERNDRTDLLQGPQGDKDLAGLDPEVLVLVGIIPPEVKQVEVRAADLVEGDLIFSNCWLVPRLSR